MLLYVFPIITPSIIFTFKVCIIFFESSAVIIFEKAKSEGLGELKIIKYLLFLQHHFKNTRSFLLGAGGLVELCSVVVVVGDGEFGGRGRDGGKGSGGGEVFVWAVVILQAVLGDVVLYVGNIGTHRDRSLPKIQPKASASTLCC